MQDTEIVIKTTIDTSESAKSIGELKKSIKELNNLSLNASGDQLVKLQKAAANAKDKIEDLGDSMKSLKGTGVEKLNASFGLLKDSLVNFDGDKAKIAFNGIGAAMKAIPIFLIIEGLKLLFENFDKIAKFIPGFNSLLELFGIQTEENTKKLKEAKEAQEAYTKSVKEDSAFVKDELLRTLKDGQEKEIKILEASILKRKQALSESHSDYRESNKLVDQLTEQGEREKQEIIDKYAKIEQDKIDKKREEDERKRNAEYAKQITELEGFYRRKASLEDAEGKTSYRTKREGLEKELQLLQDQGRGETEEYLNKFNELKILNTNSAHEISNIKIAVKTDEIEKLKKLDNSLATSEQDHLNNRAKAALDTTNQITDLTSQSVGAISSLNDTLTANKLSGLKKGSKAEEQALKQAFQRQKALALVNAGIATAKAIAEANASPAANADPTQATRIALIAIAAGIGAVQVAAIAAKKYTPEASSDSSSSAGGGNTPSVPAAIAPAPRLNDFSLFGTAGKANNLGPGAQPTVQAVVLESDISAVQKKISNFKSASEL